MSENLIMWLALSTFLVLLMQAGFACFEAGMVRSKNSINVALKNVADLGTSVVLFLVIGYPLMFGAGALGLIGWGAMPLLSDDPGYVLKALFQAMFCGTAVTIMSGALAERTTFRGYIVLAMFVPLAIYPVTGHWAWAETGFLAGLGFYDYAGGAVVHVVGGAVALAAVLRIGPRLGRFGADGGRLDHSSLPIAALGAFLLMFGWFGFNSGSATDMSVEVPRILANTALGGTAGIVAYMAACAMRGRKPDAVDMLTAMLGGLVGITAGCAILPPLGAVALAVAGAATAVLGARWLARRGVDDAVAAVPVHLMAGVVGTVFLPLFALESAIPAPFGTGIEGRLSWVAVQAFGVGAMGLYAFVAASFFLRVSGRFVAYRVTAEDEQTGLNIAEHGARSSMFDLIEQLAAQGARGDFDKPIKIDPESDAAHIAAFYNQVRERFVTEAEKSRALLDQTAFLAHHDPLTGLKNRRALRADADRVFAALARHGGQAALVTLDIDHFKAVNDTYGHDVGDEVLIEVAARLNDVARAEDVVGRLGGEEFAALLGRADFATAVEVAERFRRALADARFSLSIGELAISASFGVATLNGRYDFDTALKAADVAMYRAKGTGRNKVVAAAEVEEAVAT